MKATMKPDIIRKQARSAITGRWLSHSAAARWPGSTVVETVRYRPPSRRASSRAARRQRK
jgi:hypothetical protein